MEVENVYECSSYNTPDDVFGVLQVHVPETEISEDVKIEIVFVVDTSGSMCGTPLQTVKHTLEFIVEAVKDKALVSLVEFNTDARLCAEMGEPNHIFLQKVHSMKADGNTNLEAGIAAACAQFSGQAESKYIVLLTDGRATVGENNPSKLAELFMQTQPSLVHLVGLGQNVDEDMLLNLVELTHGFFHQVPDPESMVSKMGSLVGQMLSVSATNVEVTLPIDKVANLSGLGQTGLQTIPLGTFYAGETVSIPYRVHPYCLSGTNLTLDFSVTFCDGRYRPQVPIRIVSEVQLNQECKEVPNQLVQVSVLRAQVGQALLKLTSSEKDKVRVKNLMERVQVLLASNIGHPVLTLLNERLMDAVSDQISLERVHHIAATELIRQQSLDCDLEDNPFMSKLTRAASTNASAFVNESIEPLSLRRSTYYY
jgi:uncharacterized protein YegL